MQHTPTGQVTPLLARWAEGDRGALAGLMPLVYDEIRQLASSFLRQEKRGHTLETADLVSEAYLRLADLRPVSFENRYQFYSLTTRVIRNVLVDHARAHLAAKRGGDVRRVPLEDALNVSVERVAGLVALDEALSRFAEVHPQAAKILEMRQFFGLTHQEIARSLGVSVTTVNRAIRRARAWLYRYLGTRETE